jgi:anti-sigma factor RsiW
MTDKQSFEDGYALYRRWRELGRSPVPAPDSMALAVYAETELSEEEASEMDAALAADPDLLASWLEAQQSMAPEPVSDAFRQRLQSVQPAPRVAKIIQFPARQPAPRGPVRLALVWSALAASIVLICGVGFQLGMQTQRAIDGPSGASSVDLLDQAGDSVG